MVHATMTFDTISTPAQLQLAITNRHRILRVGRSYKAQEDLEKPGVLFMCLNADIERQFEFIQNVWVNDPNFHELGNERDPIIGAQDGTYDMTIPKRPVRRKIKGLPAFTTVKGGAYFFLPSIKALNYLTTLDG